jgi:hypothetical protein
VRLDLLLIWRPITSRTMMERLFEIQKIFAEPICHLIRLRAPGNRLLDLGFGRGHIMPGAGLRLRGLRDGQLRRLVEQLERVRQAVELRHARRRRHSLTALTPSS